MKDILKSNAQHLKMLWHDKMTVIRQVEIEDPDDGATIFEPQTVCEDVSCHYSQKQTTTEQTSSSNNISYTHQLFYDTSIEIQAGDGIHINIKDSGVVRKFIRATEPVFYFSHNSVGLERQDHA